MRKYEQPAPVYGKCGPRGLIGYEEFKKQILEKANRDKETISKERYDEIRRIEFIAAVHQMFPEVNPKAIAETIHPWDPAEFKRRAALANAQYQHERFTY